LDPLRVLLGSPLLEERLALGAVDVALEHDRPPRDTAQRALGDRDVIPGQVELRVAGLRKEDLVRVGDRHLAPGDFQEGLRRLRHADSVDNSRPGRKTSSLRVRARFSGRTVDWKPARSTLW